MGQFVFSVWVCVFFDVLGGGKGKTKNTSFLKEHKQKTQPPPIYPRPRNTSWTERCVVFGYVCWGPVIPPKKQGSKEACRVRDGSIKSKKNTTDHQIVYSWKKKLGLMKVMFWEELFLVTKTASAQNQPNKPHKKATEILAEWEPAKTTSTQKWFLEGAMSMLVSGRIL